MCHSVSEVVAAIKVADICGLCKQAFSTEPGLCSDCAKVLVRWSCGEEGWPEELEPRRRGTPLNDR